MVEVYEKCDAENSYSFQLNKHETVGALLALEFTNGGATLKADATVKNPTDPTADFDIIGALDSVWWGQEQISPMKIEFRISPDNVGAFESTLRGKAGGAELEIDFVVNKYDQRSSAKKFFNRFLPGKKDTKLKMILAKQENNWWLSPTPATDVINPPNYQAWLLLSPNTEGEAQEVTLATDSDTKQNYLVGVKKA
ncbi:MAG: hypothetical protein ACHQUC_00070 [Chlamydiales bacterium]